MYEFENGIDDYEVCVARCLLSIDACSLVFHIANEMRCYYGNFDRKAKDSPVVGTAGYVEMRADTRKNLSLEIVPVCSDINALYA